MGKKIKDLGDGKVEFTDSLGRTRIVNKGDVKDLMEMDKELRDDDDEADNPHSTFSTNEVHKIDGIRGRRRRVDDEGPRGQDEGETSRLLGYAARRVETEMGKGGGSVIGEGRRPL